MQLACGLWRPLTCNNYSKRLTKYPIRKKLQDLFFFKLLRLCRLIELGTSDCHQANQTDWYNSKDSIRRFKYLVKFRIASKILLDYELPCGGQEAEHFCSLLQPGCSVLDQPWMVFFSILAKHFHIRYANYSLTISYFC